MSHKEHDHRKVYKKIWLLLLFLTVITVAAAYVHFGDWNIFIAMLIATVKAALVCLFFMHLKDDNRLNQVVFVSSLLFLGIFVALTASDELTRKNYAPAEVKAFEAPAGQQAEQMDKLRNASPELIEIGKTTYAAQCATCHGSAGMGDGPAAAAFNPPPRDFTKGVWTQGGTPTQVFKTVSGGIPGTPMPAFDTLGLKERWGIVHFIRSLSPNAPEDTKETLAAAGIGVEGSSAKSQSLPELPVEIAIEILVKEAAAK